jgi:hypothetical protein
VVIKKEFWICRRSESTAYDTHVAMRFLAGGFYTNFSGAVCCCVNTTELSWLWENSCKDFSA